MRENYDVVVDCIVENEMSGQQVLDVMTRYNGTQILTPEFIQYLKDEGCLADEEEEEE